MNYSLLALLILCSFACVPINQPASKTTADTAKPKTLRFDNRSYEDYVNTVRMSLGSNASESLQRATSLRNQGLHLQFDLLTVEADRLYAKIYHCNSNWKKSSYNGLDYLNEFNEFVINDYQFSFNTSIPYVHYDFAIPRVKLSGNYVIVVYRDGKESDLILSRRFMVYDNRVVIGSDQVTSGAVTSNRKTQQIDFRVNYGNVEILNPMRNVSVNVVQNKRWDNAKMGLKPTFLNEGQKNLQYQFFDEEDQFLGGNEYRFFDLRSLRYPGQNVFKIDLQARPLKAYLQKDQARTGTAYAQYNDLNGNYIIENKDGGNGRLESDYVDVVFSLATESPINKDIYVLGAMTDWRIKPENQLKYDPIEKVYTTHLLLKQGWYDYQYYTRGDRATNFLENDHSETENQYEIFIYHRPMNARGDLLIGYKQIQVNLKRGINNRR